MAQRHGYTDSYRQQREAMERQAEAEQRERDESNAQARARYLDGLKATEDAARREREERVEAALAPQRERAAREWLVAHPAHNASDFMRQAWPLIKANILDDEAAANLEAATRQLRASGKYSL